MARHLVRLKLVLLRAAARSAGLSGGIGMGLAILVALAIGAMGGTGLALLRVASDRRVADIVPAAFAGVLAVWVLGPVVSVGSEGTLEVDRLALLPLGRRQLMPGLLLAAMVGAGGVTTVLVLLGAVAGLAPASPGVVVTLAAAGLELCVCVAASRWVSTAISAAARKRRWRDIALFVGPLLGLTINLVWQIYARTTMRPDAFGHLHSRHTAIGSILRVLVRIVPSGPPAEAMVAARSGRWALALAELAAGVLFLVALLLLWWRAVEKVLTTSPESGRSRAGQVTAGAAGARPSLFPRFLPFLPVSRMGAVAAKELRVMWRDPRQRATLFASTFPGLLPLISTGVIASRSPKVVLLAAAPAYMIAASGTNQFGFDGARHWTNVAAGEDMAADLAGKNLARAVVAAIVIGVAVSVLAWRTAGWEMAVPAAALAAGAFGVALGLADLVSVIAAYPMSDSPGNLFSAGSSGQGFAAAGPALGVLFGGAVLCGPMALASLAVAGHPLSGAVVAAAEVMVGIAAWRNLWQIAARRANPRQPEMLVALGPKHAA